MSPSPRKTIDPEFIAALDCPICGQGQLSIKSLANYPDFVTCGNCDSQFAVEQGGERVMYGKIPATYPRTSRFALQEWVWPEAIARRALEERPEAGTDLPPATEPPTPISHPEQSELAAEATKPPAPTDLAPDETTVEPPAETPESAIQDEPLSQELTPELVSELEAASVDEPDDILLEPPEDQLASEQDEAEWPGEDTAETVLMDSEEEDFLGDWADELESEEAEEQEDELEDDWDLPEPTLLDSEEEPASAITELPSAEDFFDQADDDAPTTFPEFDEQEATSQAEPSASDQIDDFETTAADDWDRFSAETIGLEEGDDDLEDDLFEDELEIFEEGMSDDETMFDEPMAQPPVEGAEDGFESAGIFTPPFGDDEADETDDLPEEFEPAPPMPDWLDTQQDDMEPAAETDEDDEMDAIDFTGLGEEISDDATETGFGDEEDLLASLWGDDQEAESFEPAEPQAEIDDDLAGFAGLGAIDDATEEPEIQAEEIAAESEDFWPEAPESEQTIAAPLLGESTETPTETEPELDPVREEIARQRWGGDQASETQDEQEKMVPAEDHEIDFEPEEPPPGERYRVVLANNQAKFPNELCTHCNQSPTVGHIPVTASVYRGTGVGARQVVTFRLPVCAECRDRAKARSDERQTAQLQAHLVSVLVAMILVVSALAFRIVDFQSQIGFDLGILLLCGGMGYAVPVVFLLIRASRIGKPADAQYVETTLQVPGDTEGAETAFEFRNKRYAHFFHQKNQEDAVSKVNKVRERSYEPETT